MSLSIPQRLISMGIKRTRLLAVVLRVTVFMTDVLRISFTDTLPPFIQVLGRRVGTIYVTFLVYIGLLERLISLGKLCLVAGICLARAGIRQPAIVPRR